MKKNRHHPVVYRINGTYFYPKWRSFKDEDYRDLFKFWEGYSIHQRYKNKSKIKKYTIRYRKKSKKQVRNYKTDPANLLDFFLCVLCILKVKSGMKKNFFLSIDSVTPLSE